jgi:hypothetical protein
MEGIKKALIGEMIIFFTLLMKFQIAPRTLAKTTFGTLSSHG